MLKIKSKAFAGLMVALVMLGVASLASADTINLPSTGVKKTSGATVIKSLQSFLNWDLGSTITPLVVDGVWGSKTNAAIKAFQSANGLTADSVFGKMSAAKAMALQAGGTTMTTTTAGCSAGAMFSSTTGAPCTTTTTMSNGCTAGSLYSSTTGAVCSAGTTIAVTAQGPLSVALANDNPAVGTVLSGQALADLAHFTFSGTGTLTQVTLQRTGLSTSADISNVYLFQGNQRITDGASVNTNGQIVFSGLNVAVNGSMTLSVKADLASTGFTSVSLGVTLTGYMVAGSTTANAVNVAGNVMYASSAPANSSTASLTSQAVQNANVNAGTTGYTVWSAPIQISGRAAWLKGANFRVVGSAPTDALSNIMMYVDGAPVGTATTVNANNYAFFDLSANPVNLTTGSHTIDVRGDIQKGSNRTFQFSIQNAADLILTDSQLGINIATANATTNGAAGTITISSGSVTTNVDTTFAGQSNVTGGSTNVVIGKYTVHAYGEDVKVNTLTVIPTLSGSITYSTACNTTACTAGSLNNVTLYLNGSQVGSSKNFDGTHPLVYTLGSSLIIPAGVDSSLEVHADLQTNNSDNYTGGVIVATLVGGSSINNGQGMNSLDSTIDVPASGNGTTTGVSTSGLTIQTGLLSISKNTGYSNQTVGPNSAGAKIGSFTLQNQSTTEAVRVTNLQVTLGLTTTGSTNYSNLRTSDSSTPTNPALATMNTATPPTGTSVNNFSVNFQIAPNSTHTVDVFADTGSATTGSVIVSLLPTVFGVSSNTNLTPVSAVGGQTISIGTSSIANSGAVSLLTSSSTSAQYVPTANGGATDSSKATFQIIATGGTATISEMKISVNNQDFSAAGTGTMSAGTGKVFTPSPATDSDKFKVGDAVQVVGGATDIGFGIVTAVTPATSVTVTVVTAPTNTAATALRFVPGTVTAIRIGNITTPVVNGLAYVQGLSLTVPNGGAGLSQDVYVSYGEVSSTGLPSGSTARIAIESIKYSSGGSTPTTLCTTAFGCTSDNLLASSIAAPTMVLVGSKPTVTVSQPSGVIIQGNASVEAIDVTVTADAKGPITVNSFPIKVTPSIGTAGALTSGTSVFVVKDANGSPITVDSTSKFASTAFDTATVTISGGYQLNAGQSVTFRVFVPVATATAGSNALPNLYLNSSLQTGATFTWTDSAGSGLVNTTDITSYIYNYPNTTTSSIHN